MYFVVCTRMSLAVAPKSGIVAALGRIEVVDARESENATMLATEGDVRLHPRIKSSYGIIHMYM